jgi:hypothetical protein
MNHVIIVEDGFIHYRRIAERALDEEGFQVPPSRQFERMIDLAMSATGFFINACINKPTSDSVDEFFTSFIIQSVNRGPGVGDVLPH